MNIMSDISARPTSCRPLNWAGRVGPILVQKQAYSI